MPILTVQAVSKNIDGRQIVNNISFSQEQGEKIAIAGETGSGKSCLMKMIGGHVQATEGIIRFEGQQVYAPPDKLLPGHPGVVYLSQHFELRNNYYVHEMLNYANDLTEEESKKLYEVCQIENLLNRKTNSGLSGGERQRIVLAMLLTTRPRLLLLDEPFSNLDIIHKQTIRQVVQDISAHYNCSIIMVSHDPLDILSWADTVMVMKDGSILQKGLPREIYEEPIDEYVAGLFGTYNLIEQSNETLYAAFDTTASHGGKIFLRPESIDVFKNTDQPTGPSALPGIIKSISYYGVYRLISFESFGTSLKSYTMKDGFEIGERIIFEIKKNTTWKIGANKTDFNLPDLI